jgi:hypothetical protein
MPDDREEKIQQAISIVKQRNWERYDIYEVDETYIHSLPDWRLDRILDPGKGMPVI